MSNLLKHKLLSIRVFLKVAEHNSFIQAAKELNISAAAATKYIQQLEDHFGVSLIKRNTRFLSITDEGKIVLDISQKLIENLNELDEVVQLTKTQPTGTLNVISNVIFGERIVIPAISEFVELYPQVNINLELQDRIPDYKAEKVDIAFGFKDSFNLAMKRKLLLKTKYIFCASPNYIEKHGSPTSLKDLNNHYLIDHLNRPNNFKNIKNKIQLKVDSVSAMISCALNDLGIIIVHDYAVNLYLQEGKLIKILHQTDLNKQMHNIYYFYKPIGAYISPKISSFLSFIHPKVEKIN
jgi:DNA-binding transcriptional LysR family regulator